MYEDQNEKGPALNILRKKGRYEQNKYRQYYWELWNIPKIHKYNVHTYTFNGGWNGGISLAQSLQIQ